MSTGIASSATLRAGFIPPAAQEPQQQAPAVQPTQQAPAATPNILRSGEKHATSLEALKAAGVRTYYSMVKGCNFPMPNGLVLQFLGGVYSTADPAEIAELDQVANRVGSLIYTRKQAVEADAALAKQAASETLTSDGQTGEITQTVVPQ